jgi:(E)-4-hydroxy-3-methylbut-2-enyl-diphosphate synthase
MACDYVFVNDKTIDFEIPGTLGIVQTHKTWLAHRDKPRTYPFIKATDYQSGVAQSAQLNFIYVCLPDVTASLIEKLKSDTTAVLLIDTHNDHGMAEQRRLFVELLNHHCNVPVIVGRAYRDLKPDQLQLYAATDIGGLLIDGLGDGVFIAAENCGPDKMVNETGFNILQATRTRISKTEYISCPSCGRTLFDLQETTAKIRSRTSHLKGVKIGIMGCIVNGPGEMADAHYGYVGSGPGRITLYKGKEVVKKNVPTPQAVDELINLIQEGGDWVETPNG